MQVQGRAVILVTDDDDNKRYTLVRPLERAGFEILEARNGSETLAFARQHPDLIVLDLKLPDRDGFGLCKQLKADPSTSEIPIILISAVFTGITDRIAGLEAGADACLNGTLSSDEFLAQVKVHLRLAKSQRELRRSEGLFRALYLHTGAGVAITDASGNFVRCNPAYERLLGWSEAELRGRFLPELIHVDDRTPYLEVLDKLRHARLSHGEVESRYISKQQAVIWVRKSVSLLADSAGHVEGYVASVMDVTERKKSAEEATRNWNLLRAVFELSSDLLYVKDANHRLMAANPATLRAIGRPLAEAIGRTDLEWGGDNPHTRAIQENDEKVMALRGRMEVEERVPGRSGEIRVYHSSKACWLNEHGEPCGVVGVSRDVTEKVSAEEKLKASEAFNRKVTDLAPCVLYIYDLAGGRNVWGNREMFETLGYPREALDRLAGDLVRKLIHPEDSASYERHFARLMALADHEVAHFEYRLRRADGSWAWLHSRDMIFARNAHGLPSQIVGAALDVSQRRAAEEGLRANERQLQLALNSAQMGTWLWDLATNTVRTDKWHRELWDLEGNDEIVPVEKIYQRIHPEDMDKVITPDRAGEVQHHFELEFRIIRRTGEVRWMISSALPVRLPNGTVAQIVGVNFDVTDRKRSEKELKESEERYRSTFHFAPVGIAEVGRDGTWVRLNPAVCEITGYSEQELRSMTFADITHPDDLEKDWALSRQIIAGELESYSLEKRYLRKDGSIVWVCLSVSSSRDASGKFRNFVSVIEDITERKQAEAALADARLQLERHSQNLERTVAERTAALTEKIHELESISYSLSHDMRAPLRAMQGFSTALLADHAKMIDQEGREHLRRIQRAAERLDLLVQDVLTYTRVAKQSFSACRVDLRELVTDVVNHYFPGQAHRIAVDDLPIVMGHQAFLFQVMSNLIGNALKFARPGVEPIVTVRAARENGFAKIWVEDNGIGIAPEHLPRLFQIFGRIHSEAEFPGTGIGLAVVKRAVHRLGGQVGVASEPGRGSSFWFTAPLADAAAEHQDA